jgi:hypothetical protein
VITPDEFREVLGEDDMVLFVRKTVERAGLGPADAEWLSTVGLPLGAAPFLGFGEGEARGLPTVNDFFGLDGRVDPRYRVIGTNGSGDPIVVDVGGGGTVFYLNHDDDFRPVFTNTSVRHLASCLAAFTKMIAEAQAANGPDAYLDDNVPAPVVERFVARVRDVDPPALQPATMWACEVPVINGCPAAE